MYRRNLQLIARSATPRASSWRAERAPHEGIVGDRPTGRRTDVVVGDRQPRASFRLPSGRRTPHLNDRTYFYEKCGAQGARPKQSGWDVTSPPFASAIAMPLPAANDARIARRDARDLVKDLPPPPRRPRRKNPTSVDEGAPSLPYFIVALLPQLISLPPYIFIASPLSHREDTNSNI